MALSIVEVLVFPGLLFLFNYSLYCSWVKRKFSARLQNRVGPEHTGWRGILQPFADFVKLVAKEDITPAAADGAVFSVIPVMVFVLPLVSLFVIPIQSIRDLWGYAPVVAFEGDLAFVLLLLSLVIIMVFLGGWSSANRFGAIGAERAALMMLAYEIPLTLVALAPAILAGSLKISNIVAWQVSSFNAFLAAPSLVGVVLGGVMLIGVVIYLVCLLAELEFRPFDISEAETEIVHGWKVEYSGKKLALLTAGQDLKLVLAASLLTSLYLGGPAGSWPVPPLVWFVVKTTLCVLVITNLSVLFARFRIDQLLSGAWRYLVPLAILQVMAVIALKGVV